MESTRLEISLRGIGTELKERRLAVPIYQRSFAWKREETAEFWTDLRESFTTEAPEYFLGTIVLTKEHADQSTVIDGQQRLATAAILFAAIRDEYRSRSDNNRADIVQRDFLSTPDLESGSEIPKLQLNSEDAPFFENRIISGSSSPEPSKASHKLILDSYAYLKEQVHKTADDAGSLWEKRLSQWASFVQKKAKVMVLEVPTDSDAFLIFETLNDRGADLTIADLLKNYLFGHAGTKLDTVRDGWMQVLGSLEISSANAVFTTFLRHYWSSIHGAIRERELYRSIKDHVATQAQVVDFIGALQRAAVVYAALLSSSHEYWEDLGGTVRVNVESLLRLELEQNRPLLLAALQHFSNKEKKKLLKSLVSWSVRGLIVGGIGGGTAEKAYCRAAARIRSGDIKTSAEVLEEISFIVPSDDEFGAAFSTARVSRANLARYLLIALERGKSGELEPEFVPNSNEDEVNLEHVLPKRASAADWGSSFNQEERRDYVHRLGNVSLLQKGPNGRIGNRTVSVKKPILRKSKFVFTKQIASYSGWTKQSIQKRQNQMATLALTVWSR
jgi:hypothetical protein